MLRKFTSKLKFKLGRKSGSEREQKPEDVNRELKREQRQENPQNGEPKRLSRTFGSEKHIRMPPLDPNRLYLGVYDHNIRGRIHIHVALLDRFRHIFICGATGAGKSTLLVNMIVQDILNGHGLCFIDPKGDAIEDVLMRIPEERMKDVILIDPANYEKVVGLNFLEIPRKELNEAQLNAMKEVIVADLIALMRQQTQIWGERFGRIFETLIRAILDFNEKVPPEEQLTFLDLYILLTDDEVRNKFAETVEDPIIREYLLKVNEMPEEVMEPVIRRLNDWVMNKIARQIVTHRSSSFDFRDAIDSNKIILVRVPKGEVGNTIMQLVGTTILSKLWAATKSRVNQRPEERVPFFLYVDEFANFAFEGSTFDEILSEARAFKLGLVLATQYPSQLSPKVMEAVYSNCGTIIAFNPQNPKDASVLVKRYPGVKVEDFLSLGLYRALVRVMIRNELSDPFVLHTYPPLKPVRSRKEIVEVAKKSLEIYGRERMTDVELSASLRRIKELCATQPKVGQMNELLEVLYALVIKGIDVEYRTFSAEAKKRGISVDERKFDAFKEIVDKSGYITLKTDYTTGRSAIIPNTDSIRDAFWADKFGEITDGFVDHRRTIIRAYEFFTQMGYIVEVPKKGKLRAELGDYTPDLLLRLPIGPDIAEAISNAYKLAKKERIVVEVETTTQTRPGQLLRKLARAYKAGYFIVFVVIGHGQNENEYISVAKYICEVVQNMRGRRGFYHTDEIETDHRGRRLWENKVTEEVAYEENRNLFSMKDRKYICTVDEARESKNWTLKRKVFDPSKEFANVPMPKYGEDCVVLIFPPGDFDFPIVKFMKGGTSYYLITLDGREVSEELKMKYRSPDKIHEKYEGVMEYLNS